MKNSRISNPVMSLGKALSPRYLGWMRRIAISMEISLASEGAAQCQASTPDPEFTSETWVQEQRGEAAAAFEGPHGPLEIRLTFWFESRPAIDSKVSTTRTMRLARLCVTLRCWCCAAQRVALAKTPSTNAVPIRINLPPIFATRALP